MGVFYDTIGNDRFIGTDEDDDFFFSKGGFDRIQGGEGYNTLVIDSAPAGFSTQYATWSVVPRVIVVRLRDTQTGLLQRRI